MVCGEEREGREGRDRRWQQWLRGWGWEATRASESSRQAVSHRFRRPGGWGCAGWTDGSGHVRRRSRRDHSDDDDKRSPSWPPRWIRTTLCAFSLHNSLATRLKDRLHPPTPQSSVAPSLNRSIDPCSLVRSWRCLHYCTASPPKCRACDVRRPVCISFRILSVFEVVVGSREAQYGGRGSSGGGTLTRAGRTNPQIRTTQSMRWRWVGKVACERRVSR